MQAIRVVFHAPTNTRGPRLKAAAAAGSITVGYPHGVSSSNAPRFAAAALCEKLGGPSAGWDPSQLHEGALADGSAVFVFARPATLNHA